MWDRIKRFFKRSETIFVARLQMFGAAVITVLATLDPNMFADSIPTGWLPIYMVVSGLVTEIARRLRDEELRNRS
ncbi:MAG: hypothetical protein M9945_12335 [Aquamicrobium sp.]|uniref:hypothetical protein n=1 Tax=Aquamicrobium sp. TaxID=1872579 RepID=UPI00349E6572|nr:hypothetical protein [Aquamicrobium sp.]